jgi:hypothetical protein
MKVGQMIESIWSLEVNMMPNQYLRYKPGGSFQVSLPKGWQSDVRNLEVFQAFVKPSSALDVFKPLYQVFLDKATF